jgi:asparagine synthase (glutamine-hydrolysing)
MCGIAGFVAGSDRSRFSAFQASTLRTLAHRGPDDSGWFIDGRPGTGEPPAELGRWGLLHRRLSILDLSPLGHQPMLSPDGRYAIVFNGEIYNYVELREQLEREGRQFTTHSDTEVLLAAYAHWDRACLGRLVGMFAFAIADQHRRRLFLARDCFGIKPFYYARPAGGFAFASEIKALRPLVSGKVQADRLFDYLRDGQTDHGGNTLFADVQQLPAAHWMEVDLDTGTPTEPTRYWAIDLDRRLELSFPEAVARTRDLFLESVSLHLRSDVPVGASLSGGIDSSAIVAAMRAVEPRTDIHTFSFVADDPILNEEAFADRAAEAAGATPRTVHIAPGELIADMDRLLGAQDEPFGSTSIYAQFRLMGLAASHGIKVMLDGQGADEMLAGYLGYFPDRLGSMLSRGQLLQAYAFAGKSAGRPGVGGRTKLLARGLGRLLPARWQGHGKALFGRPLMPNWMNADWFARHEFAPAQQARSTRRRYQLRERLYRTLTETSLPALLRYEDRNSMVWSIESRVPFLTPALAEFFLALPEEYLISADGVTKHVFREAMRGIVPDAILDRRDKIGFATPEKQWLRELTPWIESVLSPERLAAAPVLNAEVVGQQWRAILAGKQAFDWRVWRWVNLVRWAEMWQVNFD